MGQQLAMVGRRPTAPTLGDATNLQLIFACWNRLLVSSMCCSINEYLKRRPIDSLKREKMIYTLVHDEKFFILITQDEDSGHCISWENIGNGSSIPAGSFSDLFSLNSCRTSFSWVISSSRFLTRLKSSTTSTREIKKR